MPASDSEPQRQVVYEPCVRPSELLRRQRLQPRQVRRAAHRLLARDSATAAMLETELHLHAVPLRQAFILLSPQHPSRASVPKLPQSPPSPSAISAASAASRLLQQQRRRQPPARLSWPCGCGCRACSHRCLLRPSRHPLRRRRDQRRRQEALCGSGLAGPAASPEAGFTMASELLASCCCSCCLFPCCSCCSTACCFCPVLAGSRRCSRRTGCSF
uniref:Uncharacterized protein n=1 Tax=Macrostomum lignano TaxID=282301 RepID=A0A1I8F8I3_9PLAT